MFAAFILKWSIGQAIHRVASSLPWQIWAALGAALLLGITAWQINSRAYTRGFAASDAAWVIRVTKEVARQTDANEIALAAAKKQIENLNEAKEVRDATIIRLNREALEDSFSNRESIGSDSVRRLNNSN